MCFEIWVVHHRGILDFGNTQFQTHRYYSYSVLCKLEGLYESRRFRMISPDERNMWPDFDHSRCLAAEFSWTSRFQNPKEHTFKFMWTVLSQIWPQGREISKCLWNHFRKSRLDFSAQFFCCCAIKFSPSSGECKFLLYKHVCKRMSWKCACVVQHKCSCCCPAKWHSQRGGCNFRLYKPNRIFLATVLLFRADSQLLCSAVFFFGIPLLPSVLPLPLDPPPS